MKIRIVLLALGLALTLSAPAVAGGEDCEASAEHHAKCTADAQTCLNKMAAKLQERGWVGLELDQSDSGELTVRRVIEGSPAETAGFELGDRLVGFDGVRFAEADEAAMRETKRAMVPGNEVVYTVERNGSERELPVTLARVPVEVLAQWIGGHMLEHAEVELASYEDN